MKLSLKPTFVVDENGKHVAVQLSIKAYHKLLDELEELSDIAAYHEAKSEKQTYRPLETCCARLIWKNNHALNHAEKCIVSRFLNAPKKNCKQLPQQCRLELQKR